MKRNSLLLLFFISLIPTSHAQVQLSVYSEVSIVTADSGSELFEAFGHSAIRIKDPVLQLDIIYNYGMFDFNAPNFYTNFVKGKLLYKLGRQRFERFIDSYNYQKRWVKQQVLNLNQQEKQAFFIYLENNATPNNRQYLYDPYYNNCATKLRDLSTILLGEKIHFPPLNSIEKKQSLRSLMEEEIPWNTWGSFGINLALGNQLDQIVPEEDYMYLPNYVFQKFKVATINRDGNVENLVKRDEALLTHPNQTYQTQIISPFLIFSLLSLLGIWITYKDYKKRKRTKWIDFLSFFFTGILGIVLVFLWFFTNHSTTPNNFNVLWAFAPNLCIAFLFLKEKPNKWLRLYVNIVALLLIVLLIFWSSGIQSFPLAALPFILFLFVRYRFLQKISLNPNFKS